MKNKIFLLILIPLLLTFSQPNLPGNYYNEKYRPQFHFSPESKWMNDPNGLVFFNGTYHLFYQYYPEDIVWGPMHWGHATSTDLIHWQHLPIALYPDKYGTIFSGSAVIDKNNTAGFGDGSMVAIFTYHSDSLWMKGYRNVETQGIAYSLDEGKTFEKYYNNPVIKNSSERDFRDPNVFWNEDIDEWNMVLAVGDRIKIFSSPDLINWKYKSDFKPENDLDDLGVWECPDLFEIDYMNEEKWVMIINHGDKTPNGGSGTRYFVGDFDGAVFTNEQSSRWLDYGTDYYAGVTFYNVPNDKRILVAWMSNWMYAQKTPTYIWRSAMTLPRQLTLDKDTEGYFLRQSIAGDYASIKTVQEEIAEIELPYFEKDINLSQAELLFECNADNLEITISNDIEEELIIALKDNNLVIDRSKSGKIDFSDKFADHVQTMPLNESIYNFQIILDRASAEILLNNGKYSMTVIFFPNEPYSNLQLSGSKEAGIKNFIMSRIDRIW